MDDGMLSESELEAGQLASPRKVDIVPANAGRKVLVPTARRLQDTAVDSETCSDCIRKEPEVGARQRQHLGRSVSCIDKAIQAMLVYVAANQVARLERGNHLKDPRWRHDVVGVAIEEEIRAGNASTDASRIVHASPVAPIDQADIEALRCEAFHPLAGAIAGAIVDHDDLERDSSLLGSQRLKLQWECGLSVERGNHHACS
jgi:hypothetical protein